MLDLADGAAEQLERRRIDPVNVFENEQHRLEAGEAVELADQRLDRKVLLPLRGQLQFRIAPLGRQRQERGVQADVAEAAGSTAREQGFQLPELALGRVLDVEPRRELDLADDRIEWAVGVMRRALVGDRDVLVGPHVVAQGPGDARFSDAGLAADQRDLAGPVLGPLPQRHQLAQLFLPADELGELLGVKGIKSAHHRALAGDAPDRHGLCDSLERLQAAILDREDPAEEPQRARGDHDRIGLGNLLQAGRQIGRLSDDRLLLRRAFPDGFPDDHRTGRNADAHLQPLARRQDDLADPRDHVQARAHRPFGLALVGLRIAEIRENPVAHIFGDVTARAGDDPRTCILERADERAQILRIELRCKRRRPDQIAEQHRQLPALCVPRRGGNGLGAPLIAGKPGDRLEHPLAVAERDAQLLEVGILQVGDDVGVDGLLGKDLRVLAQSQSVEPELRARHQASFTSLARRHRAHQAATSAHVWRIPEGQVSP